MDEHGHHRDRWLSHPAPSPVIRPGLLIRRFARAGMVPRRFDDPGIRLCGCDRPTLAFDTVQQFRKRIGKRLDASRAQVGGYLVH